MSSKKKRKVHVLLQVRRNLNAENSEVSNFDKDRTDVMAASDRGSYFRQGKLVALDEEEQSRWKKKTASATRSKTEDIGKAEPAQPVAVAVVVFLHAL